MRPVNHRKRPRRLKMSLFLSSASKTVFSDFTFRQQGETTCWGQRRQVCVHGCSLIQSSLFVYNSSYSPVCMWAWVWALSQMCFLSQTVFWSVGSGTVEADVESSWVLSNPWLQPCSLNCVSSFTVTAALELLASILSYGSDVHWGRKEERGGQFQAQESIHCLYKATSMFEHNKNIRRQLWSSNDAWE